MCESPDPGAQLWQRPSQGEGLGEEFQQAREYYYPIGILVVNLIECGLCPKLQPRYLFVVARRDGFCHGNFGPPGKLVRGDQNFHGNLVLLWKIGPYED